jgi:hypothetical protein
MIHVSLPRNCQLQVTNVEFLHLACLIWHIGPLSFAITLPRLLVRHGLSRHFLEGRNFTTQYCYFCTDISGGLARNCPYPSTDMSSIGSPDHPFDFPRLLVPIVSPSNTHLKISWPNFPLYWAEPDNSDENFRLLHNY